jgi:hypothetical protein
MLALNRPLSSMYLWTSFSITSSDMLSIVDKRLIGRRFWGNSGSLLGSIPPKISENVKAFALNNNNFGKSYYTINTGQVVKSNCNLVLMNLKPKQ